MIDPARVPDSSRFSTYATIDPVSEHGGRVEKILVEAELRAVGGGVECLTGRNADGSARPERHARVQVRECDIEIVMVECVMDAAVSNVADQHGQGVGKLMLQTEIPLHHIIQFWIMFLPKGTLRIYVRGTRGESSLRPALRCYRAGIRRLQPWPVGSFLRVEEKKYVVHTKRSAHGGLPVAEWVPSKPDTRLEVQSRNIDEGPIDRSWIELVYDGLQAGIVV